MKRFVNVTIIAGLIAVFPSLLCAADSRETYMQLTDKYYFFNNLNFDKVTCHVVLPDLDTAKLREKLKPLGDKVKLDENLKDFKVIYSKKDGVSFVVPDFEVIILSPEDASDPKGLGHGVDMINAGSQQQIRGAMEVIEAVLGDFISPPNGSMEDLDISSTKGKTIVKYTKEGISYSEIHSGSTKKIVAELWGSDCESTDEFIQLKGKLAPAKTSQLLRQGDNLINMTTEIKYQNLGKLFFPSSLEQHLIQLTGPNTRKDVRVNIAFDSCQVE